MLRLLKVLYEQYYKSLIFDTVQIDIMNALVNNLTPIQKTT